MPFETGKIANPNGSNGRKLFVDALHCLISRPWDGEEIDLPPAPRVFAGEQRLTFGHALVHKLVAGALKHSEKPEVVLMYIKEICDRAYGKPKQALTGGDEDDKPLIPNKIEIVLVKPNED